MEFISEQLAAYCEAHTGDESELLQRLNRERGLTLLRQGLGDYCTREADKARSNR